LQPSSAQLTKSGDSKSLRRLFAKIGVDEVPNEAPLSVLKMTRRSTADTRSIGLGIPCARINGMVACTWRGLCLDYARLSACFAMSCPEGTGRYAGGAWPDVSQVIDSASLHK